MRNTNSCKTLSYEEGVQIRGLRNPPFEQRRLNFGQIARTRPDYDACCVFVCVMRSCPNLERRCPKSGSSVHSVGGGARCVRP